ncbi:hypothetical protein D3C85_1751020 [compost metagenome]
MLALVVEQAIGIAHQFAGLLEHGAGLVTDLGQLLDRGADITTLVAEGCRGLFQVRQGVAQALGIVFGEQLVGVMHQHVDVGQQVAAVVE